MKKQNESLLTMRDLKRLGLVIAPPMPLTAYEIKAIRLENNISQGLFASKLGVSVSAIQKWESGENAPAGMALKLLRTIHKHGLSVLG
jgi:putative transcriptional regulator